MPVHSNNAICPGGVHKVYELKRGQFYMMHRPINVDNAGGSITIRSKDFVTTEKIIKL